MTESFYRIPENEQVESPLAQLWAYIQSLPSNPDQTIRGQVQVTMTGAKVAQDSALYEPKMIDGVLSFKAANEKGALITYTAKDESVEIFTDETGVEYRISFPGFAQRTN